MVVVDSLQHAATLLSNENGKHKYDNYKNIVKDLYDWKDVTQGIVVLIVQLNGKGDVEGPIATVFDVDCPIFLTANPKTNERTMHTEKNRMGPIGKIYYEFVNDDRCFKFTSEEDWGSVESEEMLSENLLKDVAGFINSIKKIDENKFNKIKSKVKKISSNDSVDYIIQMLEIYKEH